ncbi:MAG: DUF4416 family protein [Nitrospirae bacterium]|nr:DUF4416 family protein [Nitrospirota bacterium]MCL5421176.1 DUF4416 family protein [Nitrospirota bacterium]
MRKPSPPEPVLLFTATLYHDEECFSAAREGLHKCFGEIVMESQPLPWEYSDYYTEELGSPIQRKFLFFRNMINRENLSDIKLATNEIEERLSTGGKRNINLDPGYLTPYNVILASTKNYSHRIYIGKGIFAEVTLIYKEKDHRYQPHLFTYRDYASDGYAEIFSRARKLLK